jgi:hypothetical protein
MTGAGLAVGDLVWVREGRMINSIHRIVQDEPDQGGHRPYGRLWRLEPAKGNKPVFKSLLWVGERELRKLTILELLAAAAEDLL